MEVKKNEFNAWCINCDSDVNYASASEIRKVNVKGVPIEFNAIKAYCPKCGAPLFVYEVQRLKQVRCYDEYKRKKGLLTSGEIIDIRRKYGLSQTDLARALRIGAKNIARYETGKIQDRCIDFMIRLLNEHPSLFGIKVDSSKKLSTL